MARSLSSRKRLRQNERRAALNKSRKTYLKTRLRKVEDALHDKDADQAQTALREAIKVLDRNANRGTIHANTAARRKSRLAKRLNALKTGAR